MKRKHRIVLIFVAGIFLVPALFITFAAYLESRKVDGLLQHGITTYGVIDRTYIHKSRYDVDFRADYSFDLITVDGKRVQQESGKSPITISDFRSLRVGDQVEVAYLMTRPDISMLQSTLSTVWAHPWTRFYDTRKLIFGILGSWLCLIAGLVMAPFIRERNLARWGEVCAADIIAEETVARRKGPPMIKLSYTFPNGSGGVKLGEQTRLASFTTNGRGSPTVLYDPRRPWRNSLYPLTMVDVEA